jgi:glycosyltransferase involved in cell wall biosynthesis
MTTLEPIPVAPGTSRPTVSVVIPTFRRDDLLERCLRGVLTQDWPAELLQVCVVDDADSKTTPDVIGRIALEHPHHQVLLFGGGRRGPAAARNTGWQAATGDIIAFIDDDAFPANENWIREGVSTLLGSQAPAVSGRVVVPIPEAPTDFQRNVRSLQDATFLTCNAFVRRAALEAVGGFDERFEVPFREDTDLQYRLEELGDLVLRADDAVVIHPAPRGKFAESLRRQRYSMFNALLYRKHRARFREEIQAGPPFSYYAMTILAGAAALGLIRRARAGWVALALWAVLDAAFFVRRVRGTEHSTKHLADMALTSVLIPPLSVYWRLRGAAKFRVWFA